MDNYVDRHKDGLLDRQIDVIDRLKDGLFYRWIDRYVKQIERYVYRLKEGL